MKILVCNQFGIDLIKKFEGFKANPYKCPAGVNTIGYGSTFYPEGNKVKLTDPAITEEKATELLMDLLKPFQKSVDSFCRDDVNSNQFSALCSFCYNVRFVRRSCRIKYKIEKRLFLILFKIH